MTWEIAAEMRQETVARATANVAAVRFFAGESSEGVEALVRTLEQQAYAKAAMASQVTTGDRPHVEGVRMYTNQLGVALKELLTSGDFGGPVAMDASSSSTELDISHGAREVLTRERAEDLLAPLLKDGAAFTKVKLSTKSFGHDSSEVAMKALANNAATIVEADLSDIIAGRPEAEALASLTKVCSGLLKAKLVALDLSDNALGEKGVRACTDILKAQTSIESLAFQNDGISTHAAAALLEILPNPASLKRLQLYNNMSGDEGAYAIATIVARAPGMQDFRMSSSRVDRNGGMALAQALAQGTALVKLDLKDNSLGEEVGKALAWVMQRHPALMHVNLSETAIGNDGAGALVAQLAQTNPQVEVLELACNEITAGGARKLAPFLARLANLKRLVLSENELGEKGALAIAAALAHCSKLETVELVECQIGRLGAVALAKVCAAKGGLAALALNGNYIPAEGLEEVEAVFAAAPCGAAALGPLDENDEEGEADEDDDDEEEENDELSALLGGLKM